MKGNVLLIGFLAAALVLSGCIEDGRYVSPVLTLQEMQVCSADADCILVDEDCITCDCDGGAKVSINKGFQQQHYEKFLDWCKSASFPCGPVMSDDPSCSPNAVPVCVQGICNYEESQISELQDCSLFVPDLPKCPEDYICYENTVGGLGPEGPLPEAFVGGDQKCHKECRLDSDCPEETPVCLAKERSYSDTVFYNYLCFSAKEGKVQRDEEYQACIERIESLEPGQAVEVSFMSYFFPDEDPAKILSEDYGLRIKRRYEGVYAVISNAENPLDDICKLDLDNRFYASHKLSTKFEMDS